MFKPQGFLTASNSSGAELCACKGSLPLPLAPIPAHHELQRGRKAPISFHAAEYGCVSFFPHIRQKPQLVAVLARIIPVYIVLIVPIATHSPNRSKQTNTQTDRQNVLTKHISL